MQTKHRNDGEKLDGETHETVQLIPVLVLADEFFVEAKDLTELIGKSKTV